MFDGEERHKKETGKVKGAYGGMVSKGVFAHNETNKFGRRRGMLGTKPEDRF